MKITPGIYDGATLRITGEGEAGGRGASAGDLYVLVKVRPDPRFDRHEDDLITERAVDAADAALGTTLEVATIGGEHTKIKLPAGSQHGQTFRVRERGMPKLHGRGRGDLLVRLRVVVPQDLTPRQRELLEEYRRLAAGHGEAESSQQAPRRDEKPPKDEGIFKKIFGAD